MLYKIKANDDDELDEVIECLQWNNVNIIAVNRLKYIVKVEDPSKGVLMTLKHNGAKIVTCQ